MNILREKMHFSLFMKINSEDIAPEIKISVR